MLTESEREWLERRRLFAGVNYWSHYSCRSCKHYGVGRWEGYHYPCGVSVFGGCPKVNPDSYDMHDAAMFEAMVAARLANPKWAVCRNSDSCLEFGGHKDERWVWDCEWCRLKHAYLAVEEEMDGN